MDVKERDWELHPGFGEQMHTKPVTHVMDKLLTDTQVYNMAKIEKELLHHVKSRKDLTPKNTKSAVV